MIFIDENISDLVLTTDTDLVSDCEAGRRLGGCDHHMISFSIWTQHRLIQNKYKDNELHWGANFNLPRELPPTWKQPTDTSSDNEWNTFRDTLLTVKFRRVHFVVDSP